jgi:adenylate cyclase class 2
MAKEVETKVLAVDVAKMAKKLKQLGAKQTQKTRLIVDWFRIKGIGEDEDPWFLRIRTYSDGKVEVTWKGLSAKMGAARSHKEINFDVSNAHAMSDLFLELGLELYAHQEKNRLSYKLKNWSFDIDRYPKMPAYLEIEGKSEKHVQQAIKLLGLEKYRKTAEGERVLIQKEYGLDWYEMRF